MRAPLAAAAVLLIALGVYASESPKIDVHLAPVSTSNDTFYFRGPINLQYRLTVTNPSSEAVTLRRIELSSMGPGAYSIHTGAAPIRQTIQPNGTTSIALSAWGRATGGYLRSEEPVTIRGVAYFDEPNGHSFVRQFVETLNP